MQNFRHQSVEPLREAKSMGGCVRSHRTNVAARGRPGRPLLYSRSTHLISSPKKDRLPLYFTLCYGDDDGDDGENDESQREKIRNIENESNNM